MKICDLADVATFTVWKTGKNSTGLQWWKKKEDFDTETNQRMKCLFVKIIYY